MQRAAAPLPRRYRHLTAVFLQYPHRSLIQARERHIRDASRHQRHAIPPFALGRKRFADLAEEEWRLRGREKLFQPPKFPQQLPQTGAAHQFLQTAGLVQIRAGPGGRHQTRRLQQFSKNELPHRPR